MKPVDHFRALARWMRERAPKELWGPGASDERVRQCEQELGVVLPESYKCFLRVFGYADWPEYIYGIHAGSLPGLKVTCQTKAERQHPHLPIPHHLIPFSPDGWGNHYCLDTSRLEDGECPVVFWNHEGSADQQPEQTHATFADWLEAQIRWELEYETEERATPTPRAEEEPGHQLQLPLDFGDGMGQRAPIPASAQDVPE